MTLDVRMREYLHRDWREDLEPNWRAFFENAAPDVEGIPNVEAPEIFPSRLNFNRERILGEDVPYRHLLRAFDGLAPEEIRVVVLGQDPYPSQDRATGRAFEDGAWDGQPVNMALSLQRIFQSAILSARDVPTVRATAADWPRVCAEIEAGRLARPVMAEYFDRLAEQGVLLINATWTFTRKNQKSAHLKVWKPVMLHLLRRLVQREGRSPVFLLLGGDSQKLFRKATSQWLNQNNEVSLKVVYCAHPTSYSGLTYFRYPNPLRAVNQALAEVGDQIPIQWWPPQANAPA